MKKKILIASLFAAMTMGVTSCNMDLQPHGVIAPDNAFQSIDDAERLRDGLYAFFRGNVAGVYANRDEIRSDLYHATTSWGNNGLSMYNWTLTPGDGDVSSLWGACYGVIANVNFFINGAKTVNTSEWSQEEKQTLSVWLGEAYFLRAYYHLELAEAFCLDYVGNEQSYGIPYMTSYTPTSDRSQYPSRGTLEQTYRQIRADIDSAASRINTPGAAGSTRITIDAVTALDARFSLESGDYAGAIEAATSLINSGRYPLISDTASFNQMWIHDSGKECILQLYAEYPNEGAPSYDYGYIGYDFTNQIYVPTYVPEQWVVDLFQVYPNDIRTLCHLKRRLTTLYGGQTAELYELIKFPGNPALRSGEADQNYQHKPKVFRIAEMYLINAEAKARSGQDGWSDLNALREARIPDYQASTTGDLLSNILDERVRELIGEGFRIQDLRRFQISLHRRASQNQNAIVQPEVNEDFVKDYNDYMMIYPIPQAEIDTNPNIAGQQNPGY